MIDLRSDTVTRPGRAMLEAMMAAPVGDDVYGDDPTVNELQRYAADGRQRSGAISTTGTQPTSLACSAIASAAKSISSAGAHNYLYEAGGAAVLGSIQPQPIDAAADGSLPLDKVAAKIKPDDIHFAPTRLLSRKTPITVRCCRATICRKLGVYPPAQSGAARRRRTHL